MFTFACQAGCIIRQTRIIYCAIALGIKMVQKCDFSKKLFFIWIPVWGDRGGWTLSSAGHGYRQSFSSEDPVPAPQPQACRHWGITDFYSGFPGLFMYLAGCLLSSGWLPYPLGFYLMFLLACLPPGLITLAFLSLPQSRGRGLAPTLLLPTYKAPQERVMLYLSTLQQLSAHHT